MGLGLVKKQIRNPPLYQLETVHLTCPECGDDPRVEKQTKHYDIFHPPKLPIYPDVRYKRKRDIGPETEKEIFYDHEF